MDLSFPVSAQLLDACVLAIVDQSDTYGYELTQRIQGAFDVSESTLYPVLRRLQKDGYLETYDQPFQGRNRRYYRITLTGSAQLAVYRDEWVQFQDMVAQILMGGTAE